LSHVIEIGGVKSRVRKITLDNLIDLAEKSELRCGDKKAESMMKNKIDEARKKGDSVGGIFEVIVINDNSTDNTAGITRELMKKYKKIKLINGKN